jgi:predicted Zn-dependent protease
MLTFRSALVVASTTLLFNINPILADNNAINLPDMGDSSGSIISPDQEKSLGEAFFRSLHSKIQINQDDEIQQYIESIGNRLVANSDQPGQPFHFFVVLDEQINAFAGPGGYIGVNSGLFLLTESESELASVMAHEVAHVTQRHLYRAFEAASRLSIPTAAATLAAILLGTQSPQMGQAAVMAIQAGSTQFQIDFTRDNEQEADRVGMQTLSKSDFDPRGMPDFFERLQQSTRYYGQGVPEFLRTHPVSASRIADTRGRSNEYAYRQYPDSQGYLLSKAKLRVITTANPDTALKFFQSRANLGTEHQKAVAQYGIGLVYLKNQNFNQARTIFGELTQKYPEQPQYTYALIQTELESRRFDIALSLLQKANQQFYSHTAIRTEYIKTLLKTGNAATAKSLLENYSETLKQRPAYFELLAEAHAQLGQKAEMHRFIAEYYYAIGQTEAAIMQINLAKKSKDNNFYLQAILNDRLRFFQDEEKERKRNQ